MKTGIRIGGFFRAECVAPDGTIRWKEEFHNLIPNAALDHILDVVLHGGTPITTWYIGLKDTGTVVAGDTLPSHAGWAEITAIYSGNRPEWVEGAVSGQSINNTASKASFAITGTDTVYGAMMCSAASGTTGTLFAAGDFSTSRAVIAGDQLNVEYIVSVADDGV